MKTIVKLSCGIFMCFPLLAIANNTINFNGEIVESTCEPVVVDGNYTVMLDQVSVSELTAQTVGMYEPVSAPFSIQMKSCPDSVSQVGIVLNSSTYDATTGNLTDLTQYGSDNVQIRIMYADSLTSQLIVGAAEPTVYMNVAGNTANIPLAAFYYVKGGSPVINQGKIMTTAIYSIKTQ